MLRNRAVHFCGVSDIVEPYTRWREYKKELTGREWDYDFRRLFYTWSDDITTGKFEKWVEIASRDKTCGWIGPCDLYVADDGRVHILWTERAIDPRLREKFFPDARQSHALNYAILSRRARSSTSARSSWPKRAARTKWCWPPVSTSRRPSACSCSTTSRAVMHRAAHSRRTGSWNCSRTERLAHRSASRSQSPMSAFFTATVRGGSPPSPVLELLGLRANQGDAIHYARIRLWWRRCRHARTCLNWADFVGLAEGTELPPAPADGMQRPGQTHGSVPFA